MSDEARRRAFREALLTLKRRIELLASLPIEKLDALALRQRLDAIGRTWRSYTGGRVSRR